MARMKIGLGTLAVVGVGLYFLFGRRGAAVPTGAPRVGPVLPVPGSVTMTLSDAAVRDLVVKGVVPADAVEVYVDPTVQSIILLGNGNYLISPALAAAQGAMSPLPLAPESAGGTTLTVGGSPSGTNGFYL